MREYPKSLNPKDYEDKLYKYWQENKLYLTQDESKKPYSVLMPPPNVTGILHFGHVLNHTLQDLYIRKKRMQGFDAQWFPGMDHAGIATQARVEKHLKESENLTRYDLGREKFIEKVMEWKDKYGGIIFEQLQRLGVSANWDKMLFTMDEKASNAVRDVFIEMFDKGSIYKGKRIINWSPVSMTALSDEEVDFKEVNEKFYTLRYYFVNSDKYLKVSTVRPETIFGDVAVAVNPNDERFKDLIGQEVIVPLVNRKVKIIADDYVDIEFGTGCLKVTPAHDPNDFEIGQRHNLEVINTINPDGTLNEFAGEYNGMERFKARRVMSDKLQELGLIEKIEDYTHNVGFSQRGGEPIEPYLSDQWFVKMKPLAEIALKPLAEGEINFYPNHWFKTYNHWMNNIRDWCISRQLWWGHRIPVFYAEDGQFTAARNEEEALKKLGLPSGTKLTQDEDVLDTWFSSWLWPLTTTGWDSENPEQSHNDLNRYLPTDLLVTGPDIIFFWVARMIMATKQFNGNAPFKNVYFTSMIRDGKGRKLSKSLGNSPDPLNIIDKYGADAVRFTMIYLAPLGQDVRMDVDVNEQDIPSMDIGRNFANKVWNAGRFLQMKFNEAEASFDAILPENQYTIADKWILSKLNTAIKQIDENIDNYKVTEYAKVLYDFIWKDFCDWYVEIVKIQFNSGDEVYKKQISNFAITIFNDILKLLHPVMPFITEEIWHLINGEEVKSISVVDSPEFKQENINSKLEQEFNIIQDVTEEIRKLKATSQSVDANQKLDVILISDKEENRNTLNNSKDILKILSKSSNIDIKEELAEKPENILSGVIRGIEIIVVLNIEIDKEAELTRLTADAKRLEGQIFGISKKLENEKFVSNAPEQVVAMERKKLADMTDNLNKIKESIAKLS
jgi:valyl-tRNA synthetase